MADLSMFGDKLYQRRSREALPLLVRQAKERKKITYSDLAYQMEMPNPRNLNYVLGAIGYELLRIKERGDITPPPIQCLVINKSKGLPGKGISEFLDNKEEFLNASNSEKIEILKKCQAEVFDFKQWDEILEELELDPVK